MITFLSSMYHFEGLFLNGVFSENYGIKYVKIQINYFSNKKLLLFWKYGSFMTFKIVHFV